MHVVEQFTPAVLVDNVARSLERVHQVPVPMVEIDTDVFAEITDPVLGVQIVGGVIVRYFDWRLGTINVQTNISGRVVQ